MGRIVTWSTSDPVFVWCWLPGSTEPVPAGVIIADRGGRLTFEYGRRYLERADALSLGPELPLQAGPASPRIPLVIASCLRDASPDAWGRQVIDYRRDGAFAATHDIGRSDERTYMMHSDSNRFGAIDFQASSSEYVPRGEDATLDELVRAAELIEKQEPLPPSLERALAHGTTMGGARPKATISDGDHQFIAKFSRSDDPYDVVGAEAAAMDMARTAGIGVASTHIVRSLGKKVLMVERFDRSSDGGHLFAMSALTLLGHDEMNARYATYPELVRALRNGTPPGETPPDEEIFRRVAFNIAVSNTDDHLRNHAAFWDGRHVRLTPAYDISPMPRSGETASQAIGIGDDWRQRDSTFATLLDNRHHYGLDDPAARTVIEEVIDTVDSAWTDAARRAEIGAAEASRMRGKQILNPGSRYGYTSH